MNSIEKGKAITILENEDYLRQISSPVSIQEDPELKEDLSVLETYCAGHNVMAMAAIQLGIPKRLVYIKNTNLEIINKSQLGTISEEEKQYNESRILINPTILNREGLTEYWEACASCLDQFGLVKRPYKMEIEYYDINGQKHRENFIGFESTVLSHELDHLDGILHMDIADELMVMSVEERKKFRQTHGYHIIEKVGNYIALKENGKMKTMKK